MEAELADIAVTDLKNVPEPAAAGGAQLVTGCVAVANNYFLGVCASIRNLFGGEMHGYTRLCTDARRMALVRLKLEAGRSAAAASAACGMKPRSSRWSSRGTSAVPPASNSWLTAPRCFRRKEKTPDPERLILQRPPVRPRRIPVTRFSARPHPPAYSSAPRPPSRSAEPSPAWFHPEFRGFFRHFHRIPTKSRMDCSKSGSNFRLAAK